MSVTNVKPSKNCFPRERSKKTTVITKKQNKVIFITISMSDYQNIDNKNY
jgi:hypothetical protein